MVLVVNPLRQQVPSGLRKLDLDASDLNRHLDVELRPNGSLGEMAPSSEHTLHLDVSVNRRVLDMDINPVCDKDDDADWTSHKASVNGLDYQLRAWTCNLRRGCVANLLEACHAF